MESIRRWMIVLLVVANASVTAVCSAVFLFDGRKDSHLTYIWIGVVFGQASLLAVWWVLGRQPFLERAPWIASLLTTLAFSMIGVARKMGNDGGLFLAMLVVAQFIAVQLPLWGLRRWIGWRLFEPGEPLPPARPLQFSIRQIMAWTLGVGLACGVGRVLGLRWGDWPELVVILVVSATNVLLPLPLLGLLATRGGWRWWLFESIWCPALTLVERHEIVGSQWPQLLVLNTSHVAVFALNLLALRSLGLRFDTPRMSDGTGQNPARLASLRDAHEDARCGR